MYLSFTTLPVSFRGINNMTSPGMLRNKIIEQIGGLAEKTGRRMQRRLYRLTEPWVDVKPVFEYRVDRNDSMDRFEVTVSTNDRIFFFLEHGTRVRYATMTPDFVPQTSPSSLISRQKKGGLMYVSRKRPRPGIKPRHFIDGLLNEQEFRFLSKRFAKLANKLLDNYWKIMFS